MLEVPTIAHMTLRSAISTGVSSGTNDSST